MGTTIGDDLIDQLIEDISPRGRYGTLPVCEFAGMELGPLMGCSAHQGNTIIFETINLYYRHRPLWDAVQALTLDAHRARRAAGKFGNLPPELAEKAGQLWVPKQHKLGWQGAIDLCDKIIIELDPEAAALKDPERLNAREVKIWELHEGTINLTAKLDVLDAKYVNATVGQITDILHAKPEYGRVAIDILRAKALGIMAHPAISLAMLQGSLQQPIFGTAAYAITAGLDGTEPGNDHLSKNAPDESVAVKKGCLNEQSLRRMSLMSTRVASTQILTTALDMRAAPSPCQSRNSSQGFRSTSTSTPTTASQVPLAA